MIPFVTRLRLAPLAICLPFGCIGSPTTGARTAMGRHLAPADSLLVARIDSFTRSRIAIDSLSGVVLLARHGLPIYSRTVGVADRRAGAAIRLDTKFNLGSVDKFFTRIAIWQLQQAGKLATSDTVGKHIPDYPNIQVRAKVTIQQLLDMRSGIGDFDNDNYRTYRAALPRLRTTDDYLELFAADSLQFAPGTKQQYSNGGYVVLGKIIERASGQSYYDYVQQHIFEPAGMSNTGYFAREKHGQELVTLFQNCNSGGTCDTVRTRHGLNLAVGYTVNPIVLGDTTPNATPLRERRPNTALLAHRGSSAGGGYSTAEDLLKLSRALFANRLLNAAFTDSLMRFRNTGPGQFDWAGWAGGSEGLNAVFYMHTTGHTLIVLSNYDPPSATIYRRKMWNEWLPEWLGKTAPVRP